MFFSQIRPGDGFLAQKHNKQANEELQTTNHQHKKNWLIACTVCRWVDRLSQSISFRCQSPVPQWQSFLRWLLDIFVARRHSSPLRRDQSQWVCCMFMRTWASKNLSAVALIGPRLWSTSSHWLVIPRRDYSPKFSSFNICFISIRFIVTFSWVIIYIFNSSIPNLLFRVKPANTMRVGVNLHDRMESTQAKYFAVRAVSPHPSYNKHVILNDIAILTLVRPVPRMIHGRPTRRIELPAAQETTAPNTPLLTVGWGDLREGMRDIPRLLQGTRLRLLSPTACQARIGNMLPSSQICVDNTQSDTCQVRPELG